MLAGRYVRELLIRKFNYDLKDDIEWIVLGIVLVSTLPIIIKLITGRNKKGEPPPVQESNT